MKPRILLVEDEEDLSQIVAYNLEKEGFEAIAVYDGEAALAHIAEMGPPALVLLDLMLPGMPGTEVCRRIRETPAAHDVPVIMMTAKGEEIDRVVGFEVGADDYVVKPVLMRELMLRVRAILRRTGTGPEEPEEAGLRFRDLNVDEDAHRVWISGVEIRLTALEFKLLTTFLRRRGRVQTRETLLADVWGIRADITTRTVDTHVKRLREKLGEAGRYIVTVRGVGYRFMAQADEASS